MAAGQAAEDVGGEDLGEEDVKKSILAHALNRVLGQAQHASMD